MKPRIAIILTTIERDYLLFKSVQSILNNLQDNWMVIIGYQDNNKTIDFSHPQIYSYALPYNCGISVSRNDLIIKAVALNCDYILLSADSIQFTESMRDIDFLIQQMAIQKFDRCGLNLLNRIPWEANLSLIPNQSFELDFIDPKEKTKNLFVPCDIVRNFHISTAESMIKVGYDNNLIMAEHEDEAYRYKQAGFKVCCTNFCNGLYEKGTNTPEYDEIRQTNFRIGKQRLLEKYNLKTWVSYKNLERIHQ